MPPEMPGNPDRFNGLDDKIQSGTDGKTHTKPEVTVGDDQQPSGGRSQLDIVNEQLGKHEPGSSAHNALKERESKLLGEQPQTPEAEIRSQYGNSQTDDTDNSRIRETNNLGDFTPELKEAQNNSDTDIRNEYGETPSETSEPLPSNSSEINSGSGSGGGGGGSDGGGEI